MFLAVCYMPLVRGMSLHEVSKVCRTREEAISWIESEFTTEHRNFFTGECEEPVGAQVIQTERTMRECWM